MYVLIQTTNGKIVAGLESQVVPYLVEYGFRIASTLYRGESQDEMWAVWQQMPDDGIAFLVHGSGSVCIKPRTSNAFSVKLLD